MALSIEEKGMLLNNSMNHYIFRYCFEQRNPDCQFDFDAWSAELDRITSDPMFSISPEKAKEFETVLSNLDAYKKSKDNSSSDKPKLTLV